MTGLTAMLVFTAASGSCILIGGMAGQIKELGPKWLDLELRHSIIAFGGGVLLSAVALVLVPEGSRLVESAWLATGMFLFGGLSFFLLEWFMGLHKAETPQFSAMLLDYLPECLALGGLFAAGSPTAPLLAAMIGLQNLPEGFNAFRELNTLSSWSPRKILVLMALMIPLGPGVAALGWHHGAANEQLMGCIMMFSSGGIIYLLFQDIAPQSQSDQHWVPATGAVLGFGLGLLGELLFTH